MSHRRKSNPKCGYDFMPVFTKSPAHPEGEHLACWLKLNQIILHNDTTNSILQDSLIEITKSLGSVKDLFLFIAKSARFDAEKSELFHDAISKQTVIHKNKNKNEENNEQTKKQNNNSSNAMHRISDQSIAHITEYLSQRHAKSFKLLSRRMAIISLRQMAKYPLRVINGNKLLSNDNFIDFDFLMTTNRYPKTKTFGSLFDEWHKNYGIHPSNQVLFDLTSLNEVRIMNSEILESQTIEETGNDFESVCAQILILDKRKLSVLTEIDLARKFDSELDTYEIIQTFKLCILRYFDIKQQSIQTVQFILYHPMVSTARFREYIQNELISMNGVGNKWYKEFKDDLAHLQEIDGMENQEQITLFKQDTQKSVRSKRRSSDSQRSTVEFAVNVFDGPAFITMFQINEQHFDFVRDEFVQQSIIGHSYLNASNFCQNVYSVNIHFKGEDDMLKNMVKYHHQNKNEMDIEIVMKNIEQKCMCIRMRKDLSCMELRREISKKMFNNIIDAKYIQLFNARGDNRIKCNAVIHNGTSKRNVCYSIFMYDTEKGVV